MLHHAASDGATSFETSLQSSRPACPPARLPACCSFMLPQGASTPGPTPVATRYGSTLPPMTNRCVLLRRYRRRRRRLDLLLAVLAAPCDVTGQSTTARRLDCSDGRQSHSDSQSSTFTRWTSATPCTGGLGPRL